MARPPIDLDMDKLKKLMRFKPKLSDAAAYFDCSEDTIERRIRDEFDLTFLEFRERYMVHTRFGLVQKALEKANSGDNVMLIFCLKNLCGWDNEPGGEGNGEKTTQRLVIQFADDDEGSAA